MERLRLKDGKFYWECEIYVPKAPTINNKPDTLFNILAVFTIAVLIAFGGIVISQAFHQSKLSSTGIAVHRQL